MPPFPSGPKRYLNHHHSNAQRRCLTRQQFALPLVASAGKHRRVHVSFALLYKFFQPVTPIFRVTRCSLRSSTTVLTLLNLLGPGVRIALYLQSLLSIVLIRYSPADASGAYWGMTSTALSLVISAIITSMKRSISLLDAIVVVYGTSEQPSNKHSL